MDKFTVMEKMITSGVRFQMRFIGAENWYDASLIVLRGDNMEYRAIAQVGNWLELGLAKLDGRVIKFGPHGEDATEHTCEMADDDWDFSFDYTFSIAAVDVNDKIQESIAFLKQHGYTITRTGV